MDGDLIALLAIMIPVIAVSIPIVAILVKPVSDAAKRKERIEARKMYERLALEKLDVMKTAIAMGYTKNELGALDQRLEQLIGSQQMQALLSDSTPGIPVAPGELLQTELTAELDEIKRLRRPQQQK